MTKTLLFTMVVVFVGGSERTFDVPATNEKEARDAVWRGLSDEHRDRVEYIDCVDITN